MDITPPGDAQSDIPRVKAAIALGSNIGDRLGYLRLAVRALDECGRMVAASPLYESAPVGGPEQGPYLNAVVVIETSLPPRRLLAELHGIERSAGRTRDVRWGPRTLDLDLILYGDRSVDEAGLAVPHPRFRDRRFVLEPLLAAWPDAREPDGPPLAPLLAAVADQDLSEVDDTSWVDGSGSDRGGLWVAGQAAMFAAHLLASVATAGSLGGSPGGWRAIGAVLAVAAAALLLVSGRGLGRMLSPFPEPVPDGSLVTSGVYSLVRHPMYGSVLLAAWAATAWLRSVGGVVTAVAMTVFFQAKSRHEERRLEVVYADYEAYRRSVRRRFIPWVG